MDRPEEKLHDIQKALQRYEVNLRESSEEEKMNLANYDEKREAEIRQKQLKMEQDKAESEMKRKEQRRRREEEKQKREEEKINKQKELFLSDIQPVKFKTKRGKKFTIDCTNATTLDQLKRHIEVELLSDVSELQLFYEKEEMTEFSLQSFLPQKSRILVELVESPLLEMRAVENCLSTGIPV